MRHGLSWRLLTEHISIFKKERHRVRELLSSPQAQGRLEDQRSRAPGPMDDEDFFSLLLRVQGGRMDEQRTELPCIMQT